LRKL
jgi:hypothetical protein